MLGNDWHSISKIPQQLQSLPYLASLISANIRLTINIIIIFYIIQLQLKYNPFLHLWCLQLHIARLPCCYHSIIAIIQGIWNWALPLALTPIGLWRWPHRSNIDLRMPQCDADISGQCCDRTHPLMHSNMFQRLLYVRHQWFHEWMVCQKHSLHQALDRQTLHYLVLLAVSYFAHSAAIYSYFCCHAMQSLCVMSLMGAILSEVHLMIIFYIGEFTLYAVFPIHMFSNDNGPD